MVPIEQRDCLPCCAQDLRHSDWTRRLAGEDDRVLSTGATGAHAALHYVCVSLQLAGWLLGCLFGWPHRLRYLESRVWDSQWRLLLCWLGTPVQKRCMLWCERCFWLSVLTLACEVQSCTALHQISAEIT